MFSVNVRAALEVIAHAEGTRKSMDPYRVVFGYGHTIAGLDKKVGTFDDFADHPTATGEWRGVQLPPEMCRRAGHLSGRCRSTAAGKYQIILPTWRNCKAALKLPDFSPSSQDQAAVLIMRKCGGLRLIEAGNFDIAMIAMSTQWASLPGTDEGQPERPMVELRELFKKLGGVVAA